MTGAPVPRASLVFSPAGRGTAALTDIDGRFEVALPLAGDYKVRVSGESIYGQFRSASFKAGKTQWDWTLPEGRLNLHLLGAPAKGRVLIQIADLESGSTETRAFPARDTDVLVQGVPFGVYQVFSGTDDAEPLNTPQTTGVVVGVTPDFPAQNVDVSVNVSRTGAR